MLSRFTSISRPLMLTAVLLATCGVSLAQAQDRAVASRPTTLQRTTLIVSDIDKSLEFYQRLGLTKGTDRSNNEGDQSLMAGELPLTADSKKSRLVVMKGADEQVLLSLLWYDRPPLPSARGNLMGIGTGDVIIGVVVPDLQGAYGRLSQAGVRFHQPPSRFTAVGADGLPQSGQHLYAYDPDGHLVEVSQMDTRR